MDRLEPVQDLSEVDRETEAERDRTGFPDLGAGEQVDEKSVLIVCKEIGVEAIKLIYS